MLRLLKALFFITVLLCGPILRAEAASQFFCLNEAIKKLVSNSNGNSIVSTSFENPENLLTPQLQKKIEARLRRNEIILGQEMKMPKSFKVTVSRNIPAHAQVVETDVYSLTLPDHYTGYGVMKHPKYTEAIWAHEHGHLIFHENIPTESTLGRRYETLAKRRKDLTSQEKLVNSTLQELEASHQPTITINNGTLEVTKEMLEDYRLSLAVEDEDIVRSFSGLVAAASGHNELFADLIAVINLGDSTGVRGATGSLKRSLWDDLKKLGINKPFAELKKSKYAQYQRKELLLTPPLARDFSHHHSLSQWRINSNYAVYGPVRTYLWKHILRNPLYAQNPGLMVKKIHRALMKDLERLIVNNETIFFDPYPMQIPKKGLSPKQKADYEESLPKLRNQKLIEALDHEFKIEPPT